jgi:serine/threonine-protein kinase
VSDIATLTEEEPAASGDVWQADLAFSPDPLPFELPPATSPPLASESELPTTSARAVDDATLPEQTLAAAPAFGTSDLGSLAPPSDDGDGGDDVFRSSGPVPRAAAGSSAPTAALPTAAPGAPHAPTTNTGPFRAEDIELPPRLVGIAQPMDAHLGGYHIHHRLGAGGMAEVFLARAPGLDVDVVLKRIRGDVAVDARNIRVFMREAKIASALDHENVVRILDYASEGKAHFLVMERLDGFDLRELALRCWGAGLPLPLEGVVSALADAARGLAYAHDGGGGQEELEGLVHRDVSPENLFLTETGVGKVLDFGIAVGRRSERFTRTGEVKGKVPYLPPETVLGEDATDRADVFSLAATAYFLLSGRRPFARASPLLTLKAIVEDTPALVRVLNAQVPPVLEARIAQCLSKDVAARPSASEFAATLETLLTGVDRRQAARAWVQLADAVGRPVRPKPTSPPTVPFGRWAALAATRASS